MTPKSDDYSMSVRDAKELQGAVLLPAEFRRQILSKYAKKHGQDALVNLFADAEEAFLRLSEEFAA